MSMLCFIRKSIKKRTNESHEHIAKCKGEKNTEH